MAETAIAHKPSTNITVKKDDLTAVEVKILALQEWTRNLVNYKSNTEKLKDLIEQINESNYKEIHTAAYRINKEITPYEEQAKELKAIISVLAKEEKQTVDNNLSALIGEDKALYKGLIAEYNRIKKEVSIKAAKEKTEKQAAANALKRQVELLENLNAQQLLSIGNLTKEKHCTQQLAVLNKMDSQGYELVEAEFEAFREQWIVLVEKRQAELKTGNDQDTYTEIAATEEIAESLIERQQEDKKEIKRIEKKIKAVQLGYEITGIVKGKLTRDVLWGPAYRINEGSFILDKIWLNNYIKQNKKLPDFLDGRVYEK